MRRRRLVATVSVILASVVGAGMGTRLLLERPVPIPKLRPPSVTPEDEAILATFPPRWSMGQSWALEVEQDFFDMDDRIIPGRYFASMRLAAVLPAHVVIECDLVVR